MHALLDWVFVIGAGAAFLVAPLAVLAVWLGRASRWFAARTTVLGIVAWLLLNRGR